MRLARVRLIAAALAFAAWVGWLGYLALTTARPVVVSRPQFLAAEAYVVAELKTGVNDAPDLEARIDVVIWAAPAVAIPNGSITVFNLPDNGPGRGWQGPGQYLLALSRAAEKGANTYQVTPIPRSPGYAWPTPRIYPATPQVRRQVQDLKEEFHGK